jgi:hypothetical protein
MEKRKENRMICTNLRPTLRGAGVWVLSIVAALTFTVRPSFAAPPAPALSTENFLNHLGVNTHLDGLTREDPWNTNAAQVGAQLKYIGVRLDRDWAHSLSAGQTWKDVQKAWDPNGRFWTSVDEAGPAYQRTILGYEEAAYQAFPHLIYAMGGPNEEDDTYPQAQGATLPDAVLVQQSLYTWAHTNGRNIPVSQMEFGAGWTAANHWQGDYNPNNTGIHQNYTPGPAEFATAHTYLHMPGQRPADVLTQLRSLAHLTTPGKPIAHTEFGAYTSANFSAAVFGQYLVMGALDSAASGDAAYIVYGLQDSAPEATYGFYTYPGNTAHAAATYFHTLTTLLQSTRGRYGPGAVPTFKPGSLAASFTNPAVSHLVMQKPTGEFILAAWSEQLMTGLEHEETNTVDFGKSFRTIRVYDVENGTQPIAVLHNTRRCSLHMKPSNTYLLVLSTLSS